MVSTQDTSLRRVSEATANQGIVLPDFTVTGPLVDFYTAIEEGHNTVGKLVEHLGLTKPGDAGYPLSVLKEVRFVERFGRVYIITGRAVKETSDSGIVLRGSIKAGTRLAALCRAMAQGYYTATELTEKLGLRDPTVLGYYLGVLSDIGVREPAGKQGYRMQATAAAQEARKTPRGIRAGRAKRAESGAAQTVAEYQADGISAYGIREISSVESIPEFPAAEISREPVLTMDEVLEYMATLAGRLSERLPKLHTDSFEEYVLEFAARSGSPERLRTLNEIGRTLEVSLDENSDAEQFLAGLEATDPSDAANVTKYLDSWKTEAPMESAIPDLERLLSYLGISSEMDESVNIFKNVMVRLPEGQTERVGNLFFGIMPEDRAVGIVHVNAAYRLGSTFKDYLDRGEDPEQLIQHLEAINKIDPVKIETYMRDFARLQKSRAVPANMTTGVADATQGIADFRKRVEIGYDTRGMHVPSAVDEGISTLANLPQNYIQAFLRIVGRKNYPMQKAVAFASELAGTDTRGAAKVISKYTIG